MFVTLSLAVALLPDARTAARPLIAQQAIRRQWAPALCAAAGGLEGLQLQPSAPQLVAGSALIAALTGVDPTGPPPRR